jgi:GNAT superfamily N-acetyltransferase
MLNEELPLVGSDALEAITELCTRAFAQPLTREELAKALFAPDQPALVRFAPGVGVVATVRDGADAFVRLLTVDPEHRLLGHGRRLLEAAERDAGDARTITIGADAPYFLFPGVPVEETGLCYLLERFHYSRTGANYNVSVHLSQVPEGPVDGAVPTDRDEVERWALAHWPNWRLEFLRAFDQGGLLVTHDNAGIAAACAFDVNRARTLGPIASRLDLMGKGAARGLLLGALAKMRGLGYETIEVLWVAPLVPYVRVGGAIGAVFFVYSKRL